ncbi:pyruvate dehydrogenase (acetyl-transferring) E1 component subunit alpha [Halobacteriales archaeon SW_7_65_23]|nr:MAG: pyruvate dehydrogenase (acetyl-transferring) E1 component subunit alpha [Halobacteriales archaeon SW_7_65_23]
MNTQYGSGPHDGSDDGSNTDYVQILDAGGNVRPGAEVPDLGDEELLAMYEAILLARRFDQRAISLQRQGRIATYAPMTGQEGAQVATSYALAPDDWLFPTYREHAAKYVHGMSLASLLKPLYGHRDGYAIPDDVNVVPEYIPIATQVPQAMGKAWGDMIQGRTDRAVLCHFGDGATSEGDFHEGLNFAGVFDVPAVFVCNNNQYAISTPRDRQTASETMAEKANAYGIEGVRVDGLDPLAVYEVTRRALQKTKNPVDDERRPTLIEAVQYRYGAHTTSDDPSVYRDEEEAELWRERDPVDRMATFLESRGILTDERAAAIEERVNERIQAAIDEAEAYETEPEAIFEHVYEEPSERLQAQRDELERLREKYGDDAFSEVLQ